MGRVDYGIDVHVLMVCAYQPDCWSYSHFSAMRFALAILAMVNRERDGVSVSCHSPGPLTHAKTWCGKTRAHHNGWGSS